MTPEEKSVLEETYRLTQENSEILRGIQRSQRVSMAFRVVYWIVIIVLSFGAYYFVQPYVNNLTNSIHDITGSNILSGLN